MTLFKRVFNNHTQNGGQAPIAPPHAADVEADLSFDEEFAADFDQDLALEQAHSDDDLDIDDFPARTAVTAGHIPPETVRAQPPELSSDQTLAARAAQAQIDIKTSHLRRADPDERPVRPAGPVPVSVRASPQGVETAPSVAEANADAQAAEAALATPRPGRGARRVRTRMLGFHTDADTAPDPFEKAETDTTKAAMTHPVGWMVVVSGPGAGHAFALYNGVSTIGRGSDQSVALDFGDTSISRKKHAAVAYDDETNAFFLGHGGKSNIVRLNNRPVLSTEDLTHGDTVRIGETALRFVSLCDADFAWGRTDNANA